MTKSTALAPRAGDAPGTGPSARACDGRDAHVSVAMCPPDGGVWATFTCVLGFVAAMILDGVCLSVIAYDGRVGVVAERLPLPSPSTAALEHMAVVWLCRYLIEPFSCAYINRYGFRYGLFFGSVLSVAWITLLTSSFIGDVEPSFFQRFRFVLAAAGGLTCLTLTFWLLVATPVPLQVCGETFKESNSPQASGEDIDTAVANSKRGVVTMLLTPLTVKIPLYSSHSLTTISLNANWTSESKKHRLVCIRNLTNMFDDRTIGARPMYRQDVLFNSNGMLLTNNSKTIDCRYVKITSTLTVDDVNEEKYGRFNLCSIALCRVLTSMLNVSIWLNGKFVVFAASEALIYSSSLIPFLFIKGTVGQKTSNEVMVTFIVAGFGLLSGRGVGFLLHETSSRAVSLRHVSMVLITNGLSLVLYHITDDFTKILPIIGCYGFLWGYYKSIQNAVFHHYIFPLRKLINIRGQIALVRAVSCFVGLLTAITILKRTSDVGYVYVFAGLLIAAGGVCVGLLEWVSRLHTNIATDENPMCPNIVINLQDDRPINNTYYDV
ncbi:Hypothetical protein CINCED_3A000493 [Cinara cedri]|uniref:Major facilitator superfamily domain n=1 Tax=Cinara cedri TaxID=506608 RepID=A0A5E4N3Y9_9HEMI|nr:Hypothetical protein CINCED_3A000493 [Cinara cedri]